MAKYKVVHRFKDKETGLTHEAGQEIDITVKRGDEVNKKLSKHGTIVERVHEVEHDEE